jgi:transposase-like protein
VREGVRLLIEEALEAEVTTSLGGGYYEHGAEEQSPRYRNGYRLRQERLVPSSPARVVKPRARQA